MKKIQFKLKLQGHEIQMLKENRSSSASSDIYIPKPAVTPTDNPEVDIPGDVVCRL